VRKPPDRTPSSVVGSLEPAWGSRWRAAGDERRCNPRRAVTIGAGERELASSSAMPMQAHPAWERGRFAWSRLESVAQTIRGALAAGFRTLRHADTLNFAPFLRRQSASAAGTGFHLLASVDPPASSESGARVIVPFGTRKLTGVVLRVTRRACRGPAQRRPAPDRLRSRFFDCGPTNEVCSLWPTSWRFPWR